MEFVEKKQAKDQIEEIRAERVSPKSLYSMKADSGKGKSLRDRRCNKIGKLDLVHISRSSRYSSFKSPSNDPPVSQVLDFLYLGNARDSQNIEFMKERGITHVINATCEQPNVFEKSGKIKYLRVAVHDSNAADLMPHFKRVNDFIDEAVRVDGRVLVHCQEGVSRSASLVIAYLLAHSTLSVMEAFTLANHLRTAVGPSLHFLGQLEQFRASLYVGYDHRIATSTTGGEDHYVEDMIARRWHDFQLGSLSQPVPLLRSESCHGDPFNINVPPEVHPLV